MALFPFGLVKPLRYLHGEDTWQTRFLVPTDLADGTYPVRLVMRDRSGQTYREVKTFVIASKSPTVQIKLPKTRYSRGETVDLKVLASQNTRTLVARLEGAVQLGDQRQRVGREDGLETGQQRRVDLQASRELKAHEGLLVFNRERSSAHRAGCGRCAWAGCRVVQAAGPCD